VALAQSNGRQKSLTQIDLMNRREDIKSAKPMSKKNKKQQKQKPKRLFKQRRDKSDYWPHPTKPHGYRYYFHPKHHGAGSVTDSRWKADVSKSEEFAIFEVAAQLDLCDAQGNLYNVRKGPDQRILELGVCHEQIARFWKAPQPDPWHGHPLWPVVIEIQTNRASQVYRPDSSVFSKLVKQGVLTEQQSRRLNNGKNI
jgi:hypothetical protein